MVLVVTDTHDKWTIVCLFLILHLIHALGMLWGGMNDKIIRIIGLPDIIFSLFYQLLYFLQYHIGPDFTTYIIYFGDTYKYKLFLKMFKNKILINW